MRVLLAFDSFKGTMSSMEAGRSAEEALKKAFPELQTDVAALADGGEGTAEALHAVLGGEFIESEVTGPLKEKRKAKFLLLPSGRAVMEMAEAAGLPLVPENHRDPLVTTTKGVGELILAALDAGAKEIYVGVGGSATVDGGAGCAAALGVRFLDGDGNELIPSGGTAGEVAIVDKKGIDARLHGTKLGVLCDVTNPLLGPAGAARVFGPQKGAGPGAVEQIEQGLVSLVTVTGEEGRRSAARVGAGAAGGLGWGLAVFAGAELLPGAEKTIELTGLKEKIAAADVIITGEGRLDAQSLGGKAPFVLARKAREAGKKVVAIAGAVEPEAEKSGVFSAVFSLGDEAGAGECMRKPREVLARLVTGRAESIIKL